jgi:flavin reductase (DIM6/NTAB) family NADH-FMN oxidoreductase RutF
MGDDIVIHFVVKFVKQLRDHFENFNLDKMQMLFLRRMTVGASDVGNRLRLTMRSVPQAVVVVTCADGNSHRGMTCSSFNSISLNPPLVSFAVKLPSSTRELLTKSRKYAVHLLSSEQMAQSICFSSPKTQQDIQKYPHYFVDKLPILRGCLNVLLCELDSRHMFGDHEIWYSRVLDVLHDGYFVGLMQESKKKLASMKN